MHWLGYDNDDDHTWEPYVNVKGCDKLDDYLNAHPALRAQIEPKH